MTTAEKSKADSRVWYTTLQGDYLIRVWGVPQLRLPFDLPAVVEDIEIVARENATERIRHFASNGGRGVLEALPGLNIEVVTNTEPHHLEPVDPKLAPWLIKQDPFAEANPVVIVNTELALQRSRLQSAASQTLW
jgi:hypothetical protein